MVHLVVGLIVMDMYDFDGDFIYYTVMCFLNDYFFSLYDIINYVDA